ncbi:MAG: hypothetical protein C4523_17875 [Myxococcales bacterium]|nr:MAG: hypothetical protein C4523_17875 [Myxococcales bacterium]
MNRNLLIILALFATVFAAWPLLAFAGDPLAGAENCRACHPAQYEAWKTGPHGRAKDTLPPEQRKDSRCIGCHSPSQRDGVEQVQCEHCHGNGRYYTKDFIMRDKMLAEAVGLKARDFTTCLQCHQGDTSSIMPFDAKTAWTRLPHSRTGGK